MKLGKGLKAFWRGFRSPDKPRKAPRPGRASKSFLADHALATTAELADFLGESYPDERIYETASFIQVVFDVASTGKEITFRATIQSSATVTRQVTFAVSPEPHSVFGKRIPRGEFEVELGPGEAGAIDLVMPIPPDAKGLYRYYMGFRVRGGHSEFCRTIRRTPLPSHISQGDSALMALMAGLFGGFFVVGGGIFFPFTFEPKSERVSAPARGSWKLLWQPPAGALALRAKR